MRFLSGIRGRVLLAVLAASALAYSAAATLGFLRVANASRDAMRERIGEVLDALETELRGGVASARASTPDGVEAFVVPGGATLGGVATDEIRVVPRRQVGGTEVVLASAYPCRTRPTRSRPWPAPSTACSTASGPVWRPSASSPPTPPTSCAHR